MQEGQAKENQTVTSQASHVINATLLNGNSNQDYQRPHCWQFELTIVIRVSEV